MQMELLEWSGAVHAECPSLFLVADDSRGAFFCSSYRSCQLHQIRVDGLLAPCSINSVISSFISAVESSLLPWVLLTCFGHEDSPSAWKNSQHGAALSGGECHVSVIIFKNASSQVMAIVFESVGAADTRV